MSEGPSESVPAELAQRVAQLEAEATALETAWQRSRTISRCMLALVIVLVAGVLVKTYFTVTQIQDQEWQDKIETAGVTLTVVESESREVEREKIAETTGSTGGIR